jgi:predicted phage terminase large subunit-like protein
MLKTSSKPEVIARPNQGVQTLALSCPVFDVMYGGARGGGKSIYLGLDWLSHAQRCRGRARGLLIRRTRKQLTDLHTKLEPIFTRLGWTFSVTGWEWRGPDGSILTMAYLERDSDAENYQGWDLSWLGIDEGGNFPSSSPIDKLYATLRLPGVEHRFRITANPGGPGHDWLRERYVRASPPFTPHKSPEGFERVYIPARLSDNPFTDTEEYRRQLRASGPEWLVKAWLEGDWDIVPGGGVINPDDIINSPAPDHIERKIIGGDMAFTEDERNDQTAFAEVGKVTTDTAQYHILFVDAAHLSIPAAARRIFDLHTSRRCSMFRVEGGPSGRAIEAIVNERRRSEGVLFSFELTSHMRDKIAKNTALAAAVGMGLVHADKSAPWWPALRDQLLRFDGEDGKADDMVDALGIAMREIDLLPDNKPPEQAKPAPDPRSMAVRDAYIKSRLKKPSSGPRIMFRR